MMHAGTTSEWKLFGWSALILLLSMLLSLAIGGLPFGSMLLALLTVGMLGLIVLALLGLWFWFWHGQAKCRRTVLLAPAVLLASGMVGMTTWDSLPGVRFRRLVCSPMPQSIQGLEVWRRDAFLCQEVVFRFSAAPADVDEIIRSNQLIECMHIGRDLEEIAQAVAGIRLKDMGNYRVYAREMLRPEEQRGGASVRKVLVINEPDRPVVFFWLSAN